VKQRLAALRMLFDWMVVGQVLPVNPAHAVRGPKHTQRRGKTPVLQADEARALLDAIDTDSLPGLRDRALIGLFLQGDLLSFYPLASDVRKRSFSLQSSRNTTANPFAFIIH
jgi:site-specific recombinase XerC